MNTYHITFTYSKESNTGFGDMFWKSWTMTAEEVKKIESYLKEVAVADNVVVLGWQKLEERDRNNAESAVLTSGERADVLNLINRTLEEQGYNLEVSGYDDSDGLFFDVLLWKRLPDKPVRKGKRK